MAETPDRRQGARFPVPREIRGPELEPHHAQLLDLSHRGARVETLEPLREGSVCYADLPSALGTLRLPGRILWTRVRGSEQTLEGDRRLHYQSGLVFTGLTAQQQTVLTLALETLKATRDATDRKPPRRRSTT